MKTETLKTKVNELILTGKTSLKGSKSGLHNKWVSDKTFNELSDFLSYYKDSTAAEIKRIDGKSASISVWKNNDLIIFGTINFY